MRRTVFAVALLAACGVTAPAFADGVTDDWNGGFGEHAERRSDLVLGFSPGFVLGATSGYPNEVDKIDKPAYSANSGLTGGFGFEAWLGGALKDWFTFGVGGAYYGGHGGNGTTSSGAFLVRVEAFPLYGLGGGLRDLALFANFGAGNMVLRGSAEQNKSANSGFASVGGFGVAYELARAGHFAFAPTAEYVLMASQSLTSSQALIGARVVFYGGPG